MKIIINETQLKSIVRDCQLNEQSTTSNIIHTAMDFISMGFDFVIPGSGGVIDILNGVSYIIEGGFKQNQKEKEALYLLGTISFASVILIGPLQGLVVPLKSFINGSTKTLTPQIKKGLIIIKNNIGVISKKLPVLVQKALKSKYAIGLNKKWGANINKSINVFIKNINSLFDNLNVEDLEMADSNISPKKELKPVRKLKNDIFI